MRILRHELDLRDLRSDRVDEESIQSFANTLARQMGVVPGGGLRLIEAIKFGANVAWPVILGRLASFEFDGGVFNLEFRLLPGREDWAKALADVGDNRMVPGVVIEGGAGPIRVKRIRYFFFKHTYHGDQNSKQEGREERIPVEA